MVVTAIACSRGCHRVRTSVLNVVAAPNFKHLNPFLKYFEWIFKLIFVNPIESYYGSLFLIDLPLKVEFVTIGGFK